MIPLEPLLKTRQLAEALGVSVSTIKRWVDSGALRATKTVGKHRLVSLAEALRFAREQEMPSLGLRAMAAVGAGSISAVDDSVREALATALGRGRSVESKVLIGSSYAALGDASKLADELVRPAMERIGHDWDAGVLDIYQEHRASRIVESCLMEVIGKLASPVPAGDMPLALGASPEGDHYTLSGLICELALREMGWEVTNLGPNLPLASLAEAVRAYRPRLVWLSVNHLADRERFVREYQAFHATTSETGVAVYLGGPALDSPLRAKLSAAGFGERIAHLAEFARGLCPTDRPRTPLSDPTDPESRN